MIYNYDATGRPIGMSYRENTYGQYQWDVYWFDLNLQGDIVAVYSKTGTKLASYSYAPWGKCTVSHSNSGASTSATITPATPIFGVAFLLNFSPKNRFSDLKNSRRNGIIYCK